MTGSLGLESMPTLTVQHCKKLEAWLTENRELCLDVYLPKSGGGGNQYFARSTNDLLAIIAQQTWENLVVTIFRRLQYPLRGVANEELLSKALHEIPDGQWYTILLLEDYCYPNQPRFCGSGNSHAEFRREFSQFLGHQLAIGRNPFDYDDTWIRSSPDEAMVLHLHRFGSNYELERL